MESANEKLDRWMTASFMTNGNLAKELGVNHTYISHLRNGSRPVTDSFRWKFAQCYGVDFATKLLDPIKEAG